MAICEQCNRDMLETEGCDSNFFIVFPDGSEMLPVFYQPEDQERCGDCNTKPNRIHHPGCDQERCPRCSGQLISCGCLDKEE